MRSIAGPDHPIVSRIECMAAEELRRLLPDGRESPVLVMAACSGGPDSCALASALAACSRSTELRVELAYIDHGLQSVRGRRAERRSVERIAERCGLRLHVRQVNVDTHSGSGIEAAARRARYEALSTLCRERDAHAVCTAHHMDDQIETILMRLIQGSSLSGLAGMNETADLYGCPVLRPLLGVERSQLVRYVKARGLRAHRDRSNRNRRFLRNRVRHVLMPKLLSLRPGVLQAIARTSRELRQTYDELVRKPADTIPMSIDNDMVRIDCERFFAAPAMVRLERLRDACGHISTVPHRLPAEMFRPLLGDTVPERGVAAVVDAHGLRVRHENSEIICEPRYLVRREHPRYCHTVKDSPLAPDERRVVRFEDLLPRARVRTQYDHAMYLYGSSVPCEGGLAWAQHLEIRDAVLADWPCFARSRAGFKRRMQHQPERFFVFVDAYGPVALLDVCSPDEPLLEAAMNATASVSETRSNAYCCLSLRPRGAA